MTETIKELICICCPKGCHLRVDTANDYAVTGNACPNGAAYGKEELTHPTRIITSTVRAEGAKVQVYLRHPLPTRRAAAQEVASCCTDNIALGNPVELQPLRPVPGLALQPEWVQTLTAAMHAGLPLYRATRAVHSCFVLHKGEIVFACEDLGRHNALDKAVGCAVLAGLPLAECVLYTSGRVPLDMVRKAIRAGVPVLVSKSMPTVQSAELAAEYGLQLVCGRKIPKV